MWFDLLLPLPAPLLFPAVGWCRLDCGCTILSCSSLSCLVTDFMVIFFSPCASYSEWLNSSLAGFINALPTPPPSPFPNHWSPLLLTPFLTFSPVPPTHTRFFSGLLISAPSFLPSHSPLSGSYWCLLLTGSVWLVLAVFPLNCLVAFCSSS